MRRSVGLLLTSGLLPIIALGGAFGVLSLQEQRNAVKTRTQTVVGFASVLTANKLGDAMRAVDLLAQSPAFDDRLDPARFQLLADRLRDSQANWRVLSIADPAGNRLLDVPVPIGGQPRGRVVDPASLHRAVVTRRPVIGNVTKGPRGVLAFAIRAPVVRDGKVRYVVSAVIPAASVGPVLNFHALPEGWRVAIVDGAGSLVATSGIAQLGLGQKVSASGQEARRTGRPGFYGFERRDGTRAVAYWAPIAGTDWTVQVVTPAAAYAVPATRALVLIFGVTILCLFLLGVLVRLLRAELHQYRVREINEVQSQRMEALGRLTGGVAHDFNNLLTPILGGLDLLRPRVSGDERALRYVDAAMESAERARILVSRLLAYSRRQTLSAIDLDLEPLLVSLSDLLERSVGPMSKVQVDIPDGLPPVHADRAQLELAILNLAINARDAMPTGGTVRIAAALLTIDEAGDLQPGDYVAIEVADTGTGMDETTLRHAMDPFFTTKPAEKGTGLGLSMVHGFAAQSGGTLRLRSAPGVGTVATIVLPRGTSSGTVAAEQKQAHDHRGGRILLVDDDKRSRDAAADILRDAGYDVAEAASVADARRLLAAADLPDAVVTDYLMPEETGAVLLAELRAKRPDLPAMLVTGFVESADNIPPNVPRLAKPYRADELLDMLGGIIGTASEAA